MLKTILLVDDEPNILRALSRLLTDAQYQVLTANNAKDALACLDKEKVQVIISDQRMPIMTGSELLSQVKTLYPNIVRMILSGYADFDAIKDAINEGAIYKFLGKPWNDETLLKDIQAAFHYYDTQKKAIENEQTVVNLMYQDKLTGLTNRLSFTQHLFSAIKRAEHNNLQLALIHLDLDRFNAVIDRYGFDRCDRVLQEVGKRLSQFIHDRYHLSRLGNNEFSLILSDVTALSDVDLFINNLLNALRQPFYIDELIIHITASIGVALFPNHAKYPDLLRHYAHLALFRSKELGGNRSQIFDMSLDKPVAEQLALESELHIALEKNEFLVYYQPLVATSSEKIIGAEALLRWQHPKYGLLSPASFLSLCEATGLIVDIGAWVLRTVCAQIKQWREMGQTDLCVAINLSQRQFNHPGLFDLIKQTLEVTQISPKNLELEVTESLIMQNVDHNLRILKSFRDLGLKLALDDFGTGYSSLSYLKQFSFDILKIDGSFIKDIASAQDSLAIVTAIIAMAKSLGLTIIAEGVETREQFAILKDKKCDIIQGYLFSRPVPAAAFTQLLVKGLV